MSKHLKAASLGFAVLIATVFSASADTVSSAVDKLVTDCVTRAGVRGGYYLTAVNYGGIDAFSVPPMGTVSAAQSQSINQCVAHGVHGKPQTVARRVVRPEPKSTADCLAEYRYKLRTTENGRTHVVSGLFGRHTGRNLIENEYDRCLNHIAYLQDRCPTGVFTGGSGYCIKRPY